MANPYPTLNDVAPSWADFNASFSVLGGQLLETVDFKEIKWNSKVELGEQRKGSIVTARTTGKLTNGASGVFYASGWDKLIDGLAAKAPKRGNQYLISAVAFDVFGSWTPFGATTIRKVRILGCRLIGLDGGATEGSDPTEESTELHPSQVIYVRPDGKEIVLL